MANRAPKKQLKNPSRNQLVVCLERAADYILRVIDEACVSSSRISEATFLALHEFQDTTDNWPYLQFGGDGRTFSPIQKLRRYFALQVSSVL